MPSIKTALLALLTCISAPVAFSQSIDTAKLNAYFHALDSNHKFMGSVALAKGGKMLYTHSVGYSDVATSTKADAHTKYWIGSISKTFTATLVMKAVDEKKLKLDQTIALYFPTIKNGNKITLSHLLYHRSGIHNVTDAPAYVTWFYQPRTEAQMVASIAEGGSDFTPDSTFSYSNSNYILLSYILEKTYKKSYTSLLQEKIAKPLGLKDTYFGKKIEPKDHEAHSYTYQNYAWQPSTETNPAVPMGAGAIVSTPVDLVRFSEALFGGKLVSAGSLEQMKTLKDGRGIGLFTMPFGGKRSFGHTGGVDGFSSVFCYFPEDGTAMAITSNGAVYDRNSIAIALLSSVYGVPYEIPAFSTIIVTAEELEPYAGVYASKQMPLKITISHEGDQLVAQATGQSSFPLEATAKNVFQFAGAGIVLEFDPANKAMVLKQGGGKYSFVKE